MTAVLLGARLLLAAVFLVSGLAKLVDRAGGRRAMVDFGVPARLAAPLAALLPLAELALAGLLLPAATAWYGALGAVALLLLFIAGIGANLARGRKPDCHCFGQLHSAPIGRGTLLRNAMLAAVAGLVAVQGPRGAGPSLLAWAGSLSVGEGVALLFGLLLLAAVAVEGWLLLELVRQNGRLLLRVEALEARPAAPAPSVAAVGATQPAPAAAPAAQPVVLPVAHQGLPTGSPAPGFSLAGLYGETLTLDALRAPGRPVVLLFSDPGCGPCTALLPEVARWQREHAGRLDLVLVSTGAAEENRAKSAEHGLGRVLLQQEREVATAYQAYGTPSAVLVRPDGTIGSGVAPGADAIRALVAQVAGAPQLAPAAPAAGTNGNATQPAAARSAAPNGSAAPAGTNGNAALTVGLGSGQPAPAFTLPDLDGKPVALAELRDQRTLVLFWNPGCGFCQRMLDDLKAWEANPPRGAPQLLVISTGSVEENRAMGLTSPILLDSDFSAGRQFGAGGTPSAVLVDEQGRIASAVAVGGPAVLALARAHRYQVPASAN